MCDISYDESSVQLFDWLKARKERRCCACNEPVRAGQVYHRSKYLVDGRWDTYHHCGRCFRMCEALWDRFKGEAIDMNLDCGEVWEGPPEDVAALAFALPGEVGERETYARTRGRQP